MMAEQENKIYVGNLDWGLTEEEMKKFFEDAGVTVQSADIIKDKYTGRSKGFGFVKVDSEEAIQKAIEACDGKELKGRPIRVSKARKPKERFDRDAGGGF